MSAAARRRITDAARARWAKVRGRKSAAKPVRNARRRMSAAGGKTCSRSQGTLEASEVGWQENIVGNHAVLLNGEEMISG